MVFSFLFIFVLMQKRSDIIKIVFFSVHFCLDAKTNQKNQLYFYFWLGFSFLFIFVLIQKRTKKIKKDYRYFLKSSSLKPPLNRRCMLSHACGMTHFRLIYSGYQTQQLFSPILSIKFQISALKILAIAQAMPAFFALIFKIFYHNL